MALHLYEFLFRGRPAGSAEPPAYHVILADDGSDAFGQPTLALSPAMTPGQAKARGFGLPEIVGAIDAALMAENAALKAENETLRGTMGDGPAEAAPPAA